MTRPAPEPRNRLRRAGRVLLNAGLAVLAIWFVSGFWGVSVGLTGREAIALEGGCLWLEHTDEHAFSTPLHTGAEFFRLANAGWRNNWNPIGYPGWRLVVIPLWGIGAPLAAAGAIILWKARAPKPNACRRCRYDLTGLSQDAPCPECGTPRLRRREIPGPLADPGTINKEASRS